VSKALWQHQQEAVDFSRTQENVALFFEAGTGKTRTSIEIIEDKKRTYKRMLKVLVITPQVVTFNWKKEFAMYSTVPAQQVMVLHGTGVQRLKQLQNTPSYFVVICNYETLLMDGVFNELKRWAPEIVIADESHRIKNHRAQRTKKAVIVSDAAKHKLILSGTPITQSQEDLFSQFLFLDGGKTFGRNFFTFKNLYFEDKNALLRKKNPLIKWPNWAPKKSKEKEFIEKINRSALVVKKEECLDLPPLLYQRIEVPLSKEQAKSYKQMKDDYITFIGSKAFTANLAITKAMRLSQIMTGFVMGEDDNNEAVSHRFKDVPRLDALIDLLEDLKDESKVIVWCCWKENQRMVHEALTRAKIEHRMLVGDMSASQREQAMDDFRTKEDVRVIVGSQAAAGIGINLIEANACVYYSRSFSLEHDIQSMARNYRGGSEMHTKVTRYDLVAPDTIDDEILEALKAKTEIADSIVGGRVKL
jgi:SNF2 family DNA or RNA helicase